jgi:hypothetical protein
MSVILLDFLPSCWLGALRNVAVGIVFRGSFYLFVIVFPSFIWQHTGFPMSGRLFHRHKLVGVHGNCLAEGD